MDYDDQEVIKEAIEVKEKKGFEAMKLAIERYIFSWREEIEGLDPEDESYTSLQKALVSITIYFASECRTNKQEKTAEEAFIDGCNDDHTKTSSRLWNEFARFFEDLGRPTDSEKVGVGAKVTARATNHRLSNAHFSALPSLISALAPSDLSRRS